MILNYSFFHSRDLFFKYVTIHLTNEKAKHKLNSITHPTYYNIQTHKTIRNLPPKQRHQKTILQIGQQLHSTNLASSHEQQFDLPRAPTRLIKPIVYTRPIKTQSSPSILRHRRGSIHHHQKRKPHTKSAAFVGVSDSRAPARWSRVWATRVATSPYMEVIRGLRT